MVSARAFNQVSRISEFPVIVGMLIQQPVLSLNFLFNVRKCNGCALLSHDVQQVDLVPSLDVRVMLVD